MSADDSPVQQVASAGSDVVVAAVTAAVDTPQGGGGWSNNKVLLAVIPPTLALLSVALGVWDNGNRDRAAAEAAREAAAVQAAREQAAEQRAQDLRFAELVLPKYERLLTDVHAVMGALHRCQSDIESWQVTRDDWSGTQLPPPMLTILDADGSITGGLPVSGAPFLDSCAAIDETIAPFELSLDMSLLVSSAELERAAAASPTSSPPPRPRRSTSERRSTPEASSSPSTGEISRVAASTTSSTSCASSSPGPTPPQTS